MLNEFDIVYAIILNPGPSKKSTNLTVDPLDIMMDGDDHGTGLGSPFPGLTALSRPLRSGDAVMVSINGGTPQWMVYERNSQSKLDDD